MKKFSIVLVLISIVTAPLCIAFADKGEHHSPIEERMDAVNKAYKLLRRQARRKDFNGESLKLIATMQTHALAAMHMGFPKLNDLSGTARTQMLVGFRKQMATTIKHMLDLEIAILEGRKDDAADLVNQLAADKNTGHEQFTDETD